MAENLDSDFLFVLYDVARTMRTHADQSARKQGMTRAQWVILARLERQPGLSQNELAALAEVAPITIARLVDRLESQGLVERRTDPMDRRIWRLQLTPRAQPVLREIKQYRTRLRDIMTKEIDPSVLDSVLVGLRQMKENLNSSRREAEAAA